MDAVPGTLLVATPRILDPNFSRTVVLVCLAGDEGTMGLILNRMTEVDAADAVPAWADRLASPQLVFIGGPVNADGLIGLGRRLGPLEEEEWTEVAGGVGIVNLNEDPPLSEITDVRLFAGLAGWDTGQLQQEVDAGDWFLVSSAPDDVFTTAPGDLWRRVLRRQRGRMSWFASYPDDPRSN